MKTFSSEFAHSYENYSFGYCNYAIRGEKDVLSDIYGKGFLPYSGMAGDNKNPFYMARSARIDLKHFALNSENRRIAKRFDGKFTKETVPFQKFDAQDDTFINFCVAYFSKRHGERVMPKERLLKILQSGFITEIIIYREGGLPRAYVFEISDKHMSHFWFSFYDLSYANQSLGMWLMIDRARAAKENKKHHFYMGTVYAEKALYKTNFDRVEHWNGIKWSKDSKKLRARSRTDKGRTYDIVDEWKEEVS